MAPFPANTVYLCPRADATAWTGSILELQQQWARPSDVLSVLLLLGGEIVNRALAQLAGGMLTPVTYSFGWASYAITLLLASVGDVRLMPISPDGPCLVVNCGSGYVRDNSSWVIGRMIRDYDYWMSPVVRSKFHSMLEQRHKYMKRNTKPGTNIPFPKQTGLCISVYEPSKSEQAGKPRHDLVYWSGLMVAFVQIVISTIPIATSHDWNVLITTAVGTILAFATGSLSQWAEEKWSCRRSSHSAYVITRGNGSQHAIVILGNGHGLNMEDLAITGQLKHSPVNFITRALLAVICTTWIGLLIAAAGVKANSWYLLAVGGMGIIQNVLVAGWRRDPSALGVHLNFKEVVGEMETMTSLLALEDKYNNVGRSLLPIFFPGTLLPEEIASWEALKRKQIQIKQAQQNHQTTTSPKPLEGWIAHAKTFERL